MTSAHVYIKEQAHNTIDEKTVYTIHTRMCQMFKHNRIKSAERYRLKYLEGPPYTSNTVNHPSSNHQSNYQNLRTIINST